MGKVILITGISSGFGKSMARMMVNDGHIVYGTIRSDCETPQGVHVLRMDLNDEDSIKKCVQQVISEQGKIDVLINNAGMHIGGPIEEAPVELFSKIMNANFNGLVHITQAVLPHMRKAGGGRIINFSSIGGLMGLPFQPFYSASKFAIEGFSEALRMEIKPFNIKVIVINPGDFHTSNTANRINIYKEGGPYDVQFRKSIEIIGKDETGGWAPDILAKKLCKVVNKKSPCNRYIVASFEQKLAVLLKRILPINMFSSILGSHYGIK